jgi:hypothetical protein
MIQEINGSEIGARSLIRSLPLQTGQTTSYATDDDGDLELGVTKSYSVYTTGQYSGTTNITINGKTHALSNNCVKDNRTGLMWARYVPTADIGPATDGQLFWEQWTLTDKINISFDNASGEIRSGASQFETGPLCAGRTFTVTGSTFNDDTYTVSSILDGAITTVEGVADEEAGDTVTIATVDDLIWDFLAQANANALGGYSDWRIPNYLELPTLVDLGEYEPAIDTTAFPSTVSASHWTASTRQDLTPAFTVQFSSGSVQAKNKQMSKNYVRLCRG